MAQELDHSLHAEHPLGEAFDIAYEAKPEDDALADHLVDRGFNEGHADHLVVSVTDSRCDGPTAVPTGGLLKRM